MAIAKSPGAREDELLSSNAGSIVSSMSAPPSNTSSGVSVLMIVSSDSPIEPPSAPLNNLEVPWMPLMDISALSFSTAEAVPSSSVNS
jgi:hypothetical protein